MRHRVAGYKLGRDNEHRRADRRNLAVGLFIHGQITTTLPKAKAVQPFVERLISFARKGDLASRRRVIADLQDRIIVRSDEDPDVKRNKYGELLSGPKLIKKLFDEIAPRYVDRPGGYTRIIKLARHRIGDGTDLVVLQLVGSEEGPQVAGQYSRRREKANHRMEVAAQLRKARSEAVAAAPAVAPGAGQGAEKPAEAPAEAKPAEAPAEKPAG
jgi:large subunit ribosomal protein L17